VYNSRQLAEPAPARYCWSMCGRFVQYSDPETYASRFAVPPRYNLAPTQPVLVVRTSGASACRSVVVLFPLGRSAPTTATA